MRWRSCAIGGLLLAIAVCATPEMFRLNFWQTTQTPGPDYTGTQFATGELEAVAESTQGVFQNLGIEAVRKPSGDRIIFDCTTKKGAKFTVILDSWPSKLGMLTRIDFDWEGKRDDALRIELLAAIFALHHRP